jgi:hypothetical protein
VLKLPRGTLVLRYQVPNQPFERASHGALHRRFDGHNGMALAGTLRSQKKVLLGVLVRR